jgi:ABC-2 type transport system permease protein
VLLCVPIAVVALAWLGPSRFAHDHRLLLAPIAIALAWALTFGTMALVGTLGLYIESSLALFHIYLGLFFIFSGYTIPLELFPPWLQLIVRWLPLRFQLSFPVELIVGIGPAGDAPWLLALQLAYAVLTFGAAVWLFRAGLRRCEAYGG